MPSNDRPNAASTPYTRLASGVPLTNDKNAQRLVNFAQQHNPNSNPASKKCMLSGAVCVRSCQQHLFHVRALCMYMYLLGTCDYAVMAGSGRYGNNHYRD
jgi:hypothetical protein